ncbi:phage late control D family protein [Serratia fonticola]|uniref:phage late control D family protein n=1 Tax=Serratia fonticola TaxID=47917 RepID=UPI0027ED99C8|nr:phage late control D family protein [Serratia fonticola]MDQ7210942.1 phage late control D family protein [Serratia fonticola]HBE9080994.1 phage late control D family protein [Serratia fonticola]HBE9091520.1 phage late control D family protein [Serratia fonticola]HBE9154014.1 phage late control D family protein [Serratia fonticola]
MITNVSLPAGARIAPDFSLTLQGNDITQNIRARLLSLTLTDNRGFEADQLDIELDDSDGLMVMPQRNAVLSLALGWQGSQLTHKGRFTVDEVEHRGAPDTLTIRARSADFRGSLNTRREASYHDTTLGDIVQQIAARNTLTAKLAAGLDAIKISHIDQTQETDAAFATRLASLNGAVAAVKNGCLLFIRPGNGTTVNGKPLPVMTITRRDGDRHNFSLADRDAYTGVTASWLNTRQPKPKKVKLQRKPKTQHQRALQHPKAKPATQKVAKPAEPQKGEYLVGAEDNVFTLPTVYATQAAAMRAAQAKWEKLQRGVAEFSLSLAMGRADLVPETPVQVSGFKQVIDAQPWIVSKVVHNLSNSGFTTAIELEVLLSEITYSVS